VKVEFVTSDPDLLSRALRMQHHPKGEVWQF
jgi:hypothetical protein